MSQETGRTYEDGDVIIAEDGTRIEISPEMAEELESMGQDVKEQ